jgi:hypothetical protein
MIMTQINTHLARILEPAYRPCTAFSGPCREMRWDPSAGHVPRGFVGAAGSLAEIELVLVVAEPGDPHEGESHEGLATAYEYAVGALEARKERFHGNIRNILDACWRGLPFEQQLAKVWVTESVLCSAKREGARVTSAAATECGRRYLSAQLKLLAHALAVALGAKAEERLRAIGFENFVRASAAAPPGCNFKGARQSWVRIAEIIAHRRAQRGASPNGGPAMSSADSRALGGPPSVG